MATTVGDYLWSRLKEWDVQRVFGYPGDGINGLMGALHRAEKDFDYIRVRHEEMSAFMAVAHAKFAGQLGVCIATSGPGAIHLLNGLEQPEEIASAWEQAFHSTRPVLIEFLADPEVPPLPPHITFEQARAYATSVVKGDPNRWRMLKNSAKQLFSQ